MKTITNNFNQKLDIAEVSDGWWAWRYTLSTNESVRLPGDYSTRQMEMIEKFHMEAKKPLSWDMWKRFLIKRNGF